MVYNIIRNIILYTVLLTGNAAAYAQDNAANPTDRSEAKQANHMPNWMMGAWSAHKGDSWTEEFWTSPRGGIMLGAGRSGKGDTLQTWEQMQIRIGKDGGLAFFAMPRGAIPIEFPIIAQTGNSITFENAAHDYPQRIRYWREGQLLKAEISKADGSDAYSWTYSPMRAGSTG